MAGTFLKGRCFSPPPAEVVAPGIVLAGEAAAALGRLLPLLGCGEEAAALAFDALASTAADPVSASALRTIAAEERHHDRLIAGLIAALPVDPLAAVTRRAARRFHIDLGRGDGPTRLGRIAATDAAVCTVLSRLLAADRPLRRDAGAAATLARIHRDEARHVSLSRRLALRGAPPRRLRDIGAATRGALATVLRLGASAFEILHVDPDRLDRDLRRLPDGLFPG